MEIDLNRVIQRYRQCSSSQTYYLWRINREIEGNNRYRRTITDIPIVLGGVTLCHMGERVKRSHYFSCSRNVTRELTDHDLGNVLAHLQETKTDIIEIRNISTLYTEEERVNDIIENDQFFKFLLNGITDRNSVGYQKIDEVLYKITGKSLDVIIKKLKELKKDREISYIKDENYCKYCHFYFCPTHYAFPKNKVILTNRKSLALNSTTKSVPVSDFIFNYHISSAGLWASHYSCGELNCYQTDAKTEEEQYSPRIQFIIKTLIDIGIENPCFIALFSNQTCKAVYTYILRASKHHVHTLTNGIVSQNRITNSDFNTSIPCHCKGKCEPPSCPCLFTFSDEVPCGSFNLASETVKRVCDKYCECPIICSRRFLGCTCKTGQCSTNQCICYSNKRECDPSYCRYCKSYFTAKLGMEKARQYTLCLNLRFSLKQKTRLLLANSILPDAGLGVFSGTNIQRGDYIREYTGEILNETAAHIRGAVYDSKEHSYLFDLDGIYSVDATFLGNKTRFINHQSHKNENCETETWNVGGLSKIIITASKNIKKGEELYMDYRYSADVDYRWYRDYESQFKITN